MLNEKCLKRKIVQCNPNYYTQSMYDSTCNHIYSHNPSSAYNMCSIHISFFLCTILLNCIIFWSQVWCDRNSPDGPWIVFLRRFNDSVNFNKTFQEYSDGFGTAAGEYWLGKFILCDFNHDSTLIRQHSLYCLQLMVLSLLFVLLV